jgi:putative integral membrane protein (TIGR02587 family)
MAARSASDTLRTYARGVVGGLLFSLPLLYTAEVWAAGHTTPPLRLLALLAGSVGLLLAYNWAGGLRPAQGWGENLFEAAEELALGFVTAAVVLFLIGQLGADGSPAEWVGRITLEGAIAAIGVSVGTEQLGDSEGAAERGARSGRLPAIVGEIATAGLGATLIAANVAPTDEVATIAAEAGPLRLLGLVIAAIAITGILLNASDFRGGGRLSRRAPSLGPWGGTVATYVVAFAASLLMLWVMGRFDGEGLETVVARASVLSFPAALGAAAGRLLLGAGDAGPASD